MLFWPVILHAQNADKGTFLIQNHSRDASLRMDSEYVLFTFSKKAISSTNDARRSGLHNLVYEFEDTAGNFIPPEYSPLIDNSISIPLENIHNLLLKGNKLRFQYLSAPSIRIEDIRTTNGERLIDSFSIEQIYEFITTFYQFRSD